MDDDADEKVKSSAAPAATDKTTEQKWKVKNPIKMYIEYRTKKRMERERVLVLREEKMMEDMERYLMELEDKRSWIVFQLNTLNYNRITRKETLAKIARKQAEKDKIEDERRMQEDGLDFFQGNVESYKRWQNSAAKHLDFVGHQGPVTSCRLSRCLNFMLSCSEDRTLKIWNMKTGECVKTYTGHRKIVNDADFHPTFQMYKKDLSIVSCSGDSTIRLWNSSDPKPMLTINGHKQAVYKCSFSPDGTSFISCSEDRTIRTWSFPEGYSLFVYRAHNAPVVTVRYSHSGSMFISGSDYGERKIILWDAKLPKFSDPSYFPHILHWSPGGLIRKILIKNEVPKNAFWLAQSQLVLVSDQMLDLWNGDVSDEDIPESDEEEEDEGDDGDDRDKEKVKELKAKDDPFYKDDVKEYEGVNLMVTHVNTFGERIPATEYNPGGVLYVKLQSLDYVVEEAFFSAYIKQLRLDIYSADSAIKAGKFSLETAIPWLPSLTTVDLMGRAKPYRAIPPDMKYTLEQQAVVYKLLEEQEKNNNEELLKEAIPAQVASLRPSEFLAPTDEPIVDERRPMSPNEVLVKKNLFASEAEVVWLCPEPRLGGVVFVVNYRIKDSNEWKELTYSVKESPLRVNAQGQLMNAEELVAQKFAFDQEDRHRLFWEYIREKDWKSAATFVDKRAIGYYNNEPIFRRYRIMNLLVELFDEATWLVLYNPMKFKPGKTKSVVICDPPIESHVIDEEVPPHEDLQLSAAAVDKIQEFPPNESKEKEETTEQAPKINQNSDDKVHLQVPSNESAEPQPENGHDGEKHDNHQHEGEDVDHHEQEEAPAHHVEDHYSGIAVRPKARKQKLPFAVFVDNFEGKDFNKYIEESTQTEVARIIYAAANDMEVSKELGVNNLSHKLIKLLQNEIKKLEGLQHTEYEDVIKAISSMIYPKPSEEGSHGFSLSLWSNELECIDKLNIDNVMIKSGKFGPEVDDFTMPLPTNYPIKAGQAKYALYEPLSRYEQSLKKLEVESLPTTLEEVHEPTVKERLAKWYHKMNKTDQKLFEQQLTSLLKKEMMYRKIESSTFMATRRKTYFTLPGLTRQYPNPNYQVPAVIPRHINFQRIERVKASFVDRLFGKEIRKSNVVPPVGRKPSPQEMIAIQNRVYRMRGSTYTSQSYTTPKVTYEVDMLDNLVKHDNVVLATVSKGFSSLLGSHAAKKKQKKKSKKLYDVEKEGYPPNFFTGRRAFYPTAPGLAEFLDDHRINPTILENQIVVYSNRSGKEPGFGNDLVLPEDEEMNGANDFNKEVGLIRRFYTNGFELAHHGSVNDAVFSPSETRVATAGGDGLIKIWDPRDGSFVRTLKGHDASVFAVQYTTSEQFLVSAGSDKQIIIWSLMTQTIQRKLKGHVDVIYGLSISSDCSLIVSASHDQTLKSWCTTPDCPDVPNPPRVVSITDTSAVLSWQAPPCFNCDVTAFHIQSRIGLREAWMPPEGKSLPPHFRTYIVKDLIPATHYQFRLCAENRMGRSEWSQPSVMIRTEFGLPLSPERPLICSMTTTSLWIMWFTANPKTFGSASTVYEIQCCGDGKTYEQSPTLKITLEELVANGKKVLHYFERMYQHYLDTKDNLMKSQTFGMLNRQLPEDLEEFAISHELGSEVVFEYLERSKKETHILVAVEYPNLQPGFLYILRTRGGNVAGMGAWSEPTLSTSTLATIPSPPNPPVVINTTLRSLTFQWHPPKEDGGSAITGYKIYLKNIDKCIDLPRSTITYTWEGLFPGRSYFMRVLAMNKVGASEYSDYNCVEQSFTLTGAPEIPVNPVAKIGNWNSIVFEVDIPYHNGSTIFAMQVEKRTVAPFEIGAWTPVRCNTKRFLSNLSNLNYAVGENSKDVEVVAFVDIMKQQEELEEKVKGLELLKAKLGFSKDKKTAGRLEAEIEELINSQKPHGSRIRFVVEDLLPDTMYEMRVRFVNGTGPSEFSPPSHRAKTNKASLPKQLDVPEVYNIGQNFVMLELCIPAEGGAPMKQFIVEAMSLDDNSTLVSKFTRNESDKPMTKVKHRIQGLKSGESYVFRSRAESEVGLGPFSGWTKEVKIPEEEVVETASLGSKKSKGSTSTARSKK